MLPRGAQGYTPRARRPARCRIVALAAKENPDAHPRRRRLVSTRGLQWAGCERFDWSVVGESSCADSWGRAPATGKASLSIPCHAERRYGGVLDDELLMALPPADLPRAMKA
jgi:Uncharacterised ArCR, COG2043